MSPNKVRLSPCCASYLLSMGMLCGVAPSAWSQTPATKTSGMPVKGIPLVFSLPQAAYVTLVIEDAQGKRVANIVSETRFAAGRHQVMWDGYNVGAEIGGAVWARRRVAPGKYHLRGLTHNGIRMIYESSFYSPGTPPWFTADNSGTWLSDHTPPSSMLFLPSGSPYGSGPQMLIGANVGEAGHALMWTDLAGRKLFGAKINGWMGGKALARDTGATPDPRFSAYTAFISNSDLATGTHGTLEIYGLGNTKETPFTPLFKYVPPKILPFDGYQSPLSLAVRDGIGVLNDNLGQKLLIVDLKAGKQLEEVALDHPRGVCFDAQGRLWAISNGQILRFDTPDLAHGALGEPQTVIATGLDDPRQLLIAPSGDILVSQWGQKHQVQQFSAQGILQRTFGKPGGPQTGAYDENRMQHPNGIALDDKGTLWVAEDDFLPKRISLWNTGDGKLRRAFYGGPQYGGGGAIDALDPTRLFYASNFNFASMGGLEFKLDWKNGTSKLVAVYKREVEPQGESANLDPINRDYLAPGIELPETAVPERRVVIGGRQYFINTTNSRARNNQSAGIWLRDEKGIIQPVAFIGGGTSWFQRFFGDKSHPDYANNAAIGKHLEELVKAQGGDWPDIFGTWSDLNGDHRMQLEEWQVKVFPRNTTSFTNRAGQTERAQYFGSHSLSTTDLSFVGGWSTTVPAPTFNAKGVPIYDLNRAKIAIPPDANFRDRVDGDVARPWLDGGGGWLLQTPNRGYKNGVLQWTYADQDSRIAPTIPGTLLKVSRVIGPPFRPITGQAGTVYAQNDDKGAIYLMTVDGLYLQTLGGDMRLKPLWRMPSLKRGEELKNVSFEDELFHPNLTQTADGKVYLVVGKEHSSIVRLDGFDTVQRRDFGSLTVTPAQVKDLPPTLLVGPENTPRQSLPLELGGTPPTVDGQLNEWKTWARLDARASASVRVTNDRLFAAFRTGDTNALNNSGGQSAFAFKAGGALDLMLSTRAGENRDNSDPREGDLRLLVTQVAGKTRAVLYRAVASGAAAEAKTEFASPIGRVVFDEVRDISDQVELAGNDGNFEFAVPLEVLGFKPNVGELYRGDLGVLRGDGNQTTQRLYWNNRDTSIVSDVPGEAKLQPGNWGIFSIVTKPQS